MKILDENEIKKGREEIKQFCGFDIINDSIYEMVESGRADFLDLVVYQFVNNQFVSNIIFTLLTREQNKDFILALNKEKKYSYLINDFRHFMQDGSHNRSFWMFLRELFFIMNAEATSINKNRLLHLIMCAISSGDELYFNVIKVNNIEFEKYMADKKMLSDNLRAFEDRECKRQENLKKASKLSAEARGKYKQQAENIWVKNELWKYRTDHIIRYYEDMIKQHRIYSNNGEDEETIRSKSIKKLKENWFPSFRKKHNTTNS